MQSYILAWLRSAYSRICLPDYVIQVTIIKTTNIPELIKNILLLYSYVFTQNLLNCVECDVTELFFNCGSRIRSRTAISRDSTYRS